MPQEYVFHAIGGHVTQEVLLQVMKVEFINLNNTFRYEMKTPNEVPSLPEFDPATGQRINQIRITFNKELDPKSLTPAPGGIADPHVNSFLVFQSTYQYPGSVRLAAANIAVFSGGTRGDPAPFTQGVYTVTLFGDKDNPGRDIIQSSSGGGLDGDIPAFWNPGDPFSGDGLIGGSFKFNFEIIP